MSSAPFDPRVGVHTRLTDEPERAKIERTLFMVREMGAGSIVEYFPWAYFQPAPARWDWTHVDWVMEAAARQGVRVYARIDLVPEWARPLGSPSRLLPPERTGDYAQAAARFAARYKDQLAGVVVWNEPNLAYEWGFRPVDPAGYVELLRATALAVRQASPGVPVLMAGLAPTLDRSPQALNDLEFLEAVYQQGGGAWFDALAAHSYGWTAPFGEPADPGKINYRRLELLRAVMERYGDNAKAIVLTEGGWNDHPRWTKAVRAPQRVRYTLEAYAAAEEWPWLAATHLWLFRLPKPAYNASDGFTFVNVDFSPRPVYTAVQDWVRSKRG